MDAPTAAELQVHPTVVAAFAAAWADSLPDDPTLRHEEGGFIYVNATTGEVIVRRAQPGEWSELDLNSPPTLPDCFLVATYHTHPNPIAEGWDPHPSLPDRRWAFDTGVPWFVISELGVFVTGPDRRVGGLTGAGGYPR
jgi:hypothetical protein